MGVNHGALEMSPGSPDAVICGERERKNNLVVPFYVPYINVWIATCAAIEGVGPKCCLYSLQCVVVCP